WSGCTDTAAENYNPIANQDDGTCIYCSQIIYTITPDASVCSGDPVALTASGATNYLWSTSDTISSVTVTPDTSQTYSVYLNNQLYCWEIATVDIYVSYDAQAGFWPDMSNQNDGDTILFVNTSTNAANYFWDFGDSATSTEKNPRHLYTGEGTKTVMLIASNPCSADTFYMTLTIVGQNEHEISDFKFQVYPNPSDGIYNLQLENYYLKNNNSELCIYNVLGEKVAPSNSPPVGGGGLNSRQGWAIDISNQPQGIYIVQLIIGDAFYRQRIVKN
ncbi:MAG: PKD domain-containing protein, partial [Bacteroidota bacterium]